ncbi:hypothetical protein [Pseudomonas extremaustralis]|uniref:hypothetical protein n=1 Tax=Pseudomonas extremaustralis TaxID=359110 RepID=UPI002AA5EB47|nr:hypothetical protein [Pseudomonas extremaustralis]
MDRQIVYPGQILPETTLLQMAKDAMIGSSKLAAAMLGTSTIANGFAVTPTGPASLQIVVAPGEIYSLANIDSLAFSTLPADTTHSILKQGIMLDGVTLSCPAPTTTGQSINYLVQVTYQDQDSTPVLLPYYNSANPALPYSGMGNNGLTQNTSRKGVAIVQVKAGASAATGSQVTPAPDSGYVGLFVATVAYGQTTITSGNITQYAGAPLLPSGVLQSIQGGNTTYALDTGAVNACAATFFPAITALVDGLTLRFKAANSNTGATTFSPNGISVAPIVGGNHAALQGGEIAATGDVWVQWNSSIGGGSWVLVESSGGGLQVASGTKSQHAISAGQAQAQSVTAFTTAGVSTALTLAPVPAITAYAANQRFRVKFGLASTGADTLNISGIGAKSIKQYDSSGAKVAAVFAANQLADVEYDGTDIVLLDQLPAGGANLFAIQGTFKNLTGSATGLSAVVTFAADELMVENSSNQYQVLRSVNLSSLSFANAGANGLDTGAGGSQTASTWYSVWAIWNGATTAGLLSISSTAPTMPSGYTHKARLGWVRTDGTANKYPLRFFQAGRVVQYSIAAASNSLSLPLMASGTSGNTATPSYSVMSTSNFVPPTAASIIGSLAPGSTVGPTSAIVAPNNAYGGYTSNTVSPPVVMASGTGATPSSVSFKFNLESSNIYWASSVVSYVYCLGWEDNL